MKAYQILTDKEHFMCRYELFCGLPMSRARLLTPSAEPSSMSAVGVAITGSSCYQLSLMDSDQRAALIRKLYGKDGIGLSIARLSVASSDYSPELYSYDDVDGDVSLAHFSIEKDEKYIIPMLKEILAVAPDLFLFASPWSPPYWMKTGGNMCGGYMRDCYVECYAEYIIKFIKAYAAHGIRISAITPQNECDTQQEETMPCCIWHPEIEARFIRLLRKRLCEEGLDVKIWMFDHNFAEADSRVLWSLKNLPGLAESCDGAAFHYYGGHIEETARLRSCFPSLPLHFTEGGPRLYDNYATDWCKWGIMLTKAIENGFSDLTGWNLMLNELSGPDVGPFMCGGLITRDSRSGELSYSGQYKAFAHAAPYIGRGAQIYPLIPDYRSDLRMSAYPAVERSIYGFLSQRGEQRAAVLINPNGEKRQVQLLIDGEYLYVELTPESISTVVIEK